MTTNKIQEILSHYQNPGRDSLIPILQEIQDTEGYLSRESIETIGELLDIPLSKIYGVATFYNQFRFQSIGKYHIQCCRGTACHVKGSLRILETLQEELGIKAGETTPDGLFSIEVVACIGACGLAPVITVNGEFFAKLTPERIHEIIETCKQK